jgi:succinoglycan biosynthesis protein ExoM
MTIQGSNMNGAQHASPADYTPGKAAGIQHVAVCIATSGRPRMLARCLASVIGQTIPRDLYVRIVIASNGPRQQETRDYVEAFKRTTRFPITLLHDDAQNISRARNSAMYAGYTHGAEWIVFIDDDEVADADWLAELMAPEYRHAPILAGRNIKVWPAGCFWGREKPAKEHVEGAETKALGTGNVRFTVDLLCLGFMFLPELGLAGGEDSHFFTECRAAGFKTIATNRAVTRETVHPERVTYRYLVGREYLSHASASYRKRLADGFLPVAWLAAVKTAIAGVGLVELAVVAPLAAIFSAYRFKQFALRGGKRLARAAGVLATCVGHLPQPYRVIHGE